VQDAEQAHQKFPLSRMLARQYADAMIAAGKLEQAAQFLRDQVLQYREEPKLYDQLAKTYAAQGKIALQHMALAESYVLSGATPAAVDQLDLARKAKDVSFYDQAVIDARERELQQRQRDEKKEKKDRGEYADSAPRLKIETSNDAVPGSRFGTDNNSMDTPARRQPGRPYDPAGLRSQ
jgi:predicted Zn-dependent protease